MESSLKSNFLIIDPQARGHALSYLLAQSDDVGCVYLSRHSPLPDIGVSKIIPVYWLEELLPEAYPEIIAFCHSAEIHCVIVGTADAMAMGLVDSLGAANILVVGANKKALRLESSKSFAKAFFHRYAIPTPLYQTYSSIDGIEALEDVIFPCFIKSDQIIRSHYSL